ncbi:MAG: hypothetical protein OEY23_07720, partial [Acidimicrobiia bacterium]|nr:hypothetical protein [Acidimicrobiia bacterium]
MGGLDPISADFAVHSTPAAEAVAERIAVAVAGAGGRAHLVGGCVRDALLGRRAADLDIEVFGVPTDELRDLVSAIAPVSLVGASFGV